MPTYEILCKRCKKTVLGTYTTPKPVPDLRSFSAGGAVCAACQPAVVGKVQEEAKRQRRLQTQGARAANKARSPEERKAWRDERAAHRARATAPVLRELAEAPPAGPKKKKDK